jgi:hypothetical protein
MELRSMALDQLLLTPEPDGVSDRRPYQVAQHAEDDDPQEREVVGVNIKTGEQHRGFAARESDDAADRRHRGDPGQAEGIDHARGPVNDGAG